MAADGIAPGIFVGVDSGGTRTNVQILERDAEGTQLREDSDEVYKTLSGALREDLVPTTLRSILAPLEMFVHGAASDALPIYIWISAAGFTEWTRDRYIVVLNELAPDLFGDRIRAIGMANDAVSLLLGMDADAVIIAGTGSNVIVRNREGGLYQSGGHEWVACDFGSGFWIGLRAIRSAYRDLEDGKSSVLLQRMRELYGLRDDRAVIHKLRDLAVGDENFKKEVARFTQDVCHAGERGDKAAQDIVKSEAEELADVTAVALRRAVGREGLEEGVRVIQCGSLIGNPFYRSSFEAQLEMRLLSGDERAAKLDSRHVNTGGEAAIRLAQELADDPGRHLGLDNAFRPAVVRTGG